MTDFNFEKLHYHAGTKVDAGQKWSDVSKTQLSPREVDKLSKAGVGKACAWPGVGVKKSAGSDS